MFFIGWGNTHVIDFVIIVFMFAKYGYFIQTKLIFDG